MSRGRQHPDSDWHQWKSRWGASALAGAVSVLIHAGALTALCFIGFSQSSAEPGHRAVPSADISSVSRLINQVRVTPTPGISRPASAIAVSKPAPVDRVFPRRIFDDQPRTDLPGEKTAGFHWPRAIELAQQVRFYNLQAGERRVCYVIDATASIAGSFASVRRELIDSVGGLEPDQFFSIVFYGSGGLRDFGAPAMVRATADNIDAACEFAGLISASGSGDALAALRRAEEICSATKGTGVIYFLTDALELDRSQAVRFGESVEKLLLELGPGTRINTIALTPGKFDRAILEQIAESSGGAFVCPAETGAEDPGMIDLTDIDFLEGTAVKDE